jgi:folate-binding protein YgfZ
VRSIGSGGSIDTFRDERVDPSTSGILDGVLELASSERKLASGVVAFAVERDVVEVTGIDAAIFLQGQVSANAIALRIGASTATLLLQPRGRIVAWGRLTRLAADRFWFDVDPGHGAAARDRLQRFLLRVDVGLRLATRTMVAVRGPEADALRADAPASAVMIEPVWTGAAGIDVLLDAGDPATGDEDWFPPVEPGHPDALEAERIALGQPAMGAELDESTIPAAAGVVDRSVDFTKGCYVGQELVARINSRGAETPTRLVGVRFRAGPPPAPGSELTADGMVVATVTSSIESGRWGPIGLAYLKRGVPLGPVTAPPDGGDQVVQAELVELPLTSLIARSG